MSSPQPGAADWARFNGLAPTSPPAIGDTRAPSWPLSSTPFGPPPFPGGGGVLGPLPGLLGSAACPLLSQSVQPAPQPNAANSSSLDRLALFDPLAPMSCVMPLRGFGPMPAPGWGPMYARVTRARSSPFCSGASPCRRGRRPRRNRRMRSPDAKVLDRTLQIGLLGKLKLKKCARQWGLLPAPCREAESGA